MSRVNPPDPAGKVRGTEVSRIAGQRAGMAQLLLVARLRVRNRRDLAADLLERALQVMLVTFRNWFSPWRDRATGRDASAAADTPAQPSSDKQQRP